MDKFSNMLDELISVKQDIERYKQESLDRYSHITTDIGYLGAVLYHIFRPYKIKNNNSGNIKKIQAHSIYDFNFYRMGLDICIKMNPKICEMDKNILKDIICSINIDKYSKQNIYMSLCFLMYEYLPFNLYEMEIALDKKACFKVKNAQQKYKETEDREYINLINLYTRINSASYARILKKHRINIKYTEPTVEIYNKIYKKCSYDIRTFHIYDKDINKTIQLLFSNNPIDAINDMYLFIGETVKSKIYEQIAIRCFADRYKRDIDIDKLHDCIMINDGLTRYEIQLFKTMHRAGIKYYIKLLK